MCVGKALEPNVRQIVKFTRQRSHTTGKVTSARLPLGCACCSMAATCGLHWWDRAFPHGSSLVGERILAQTPVV